MNDLPIQVYANTVSLSQVCSGIEAVKGTMKLHTVFTHEPNRIYVRQISCRVSTEHIIQSLGYC